MHVVTLFPPPAAAAARPLPLPSAPFPRSTAQQRDFEAPNMLLCVRSKGRYSELKSLNLNPCKPHQLAVAAADPLIRLYDRRMLSTGGRGPPGGGL